MRIVFCYSQADLLKRKQADAVLDFVQFWKSAHGELPPELVFDSKLTTYAKLNQLNKMGITFMTIGARVERWNEKTGLLGAACSKLLPEAKNRTPSLRVQTRRPVNE